MKTPFSPAVRRRKNMAVNAPKLTVESINFYIKHGIISKETGDKLKVKMRVKDGCESSNHKE